jgi:hypothetical protein
MYGRTAQRRLLKIRRLLEPDALFTARLLAHRLHGVRMVARLRAPRYTGLQLSSLKFSSAGNVTGK